MRFCRSLTLAYVKQPIVKFVLQYIVLLNVSEPPKDITYGLIVVCTAIKQLCIL